MVRIFLIQKNTFKPLLNKQTTPRTIIKSFFFSIQRSISFLFSFSIFSLLTCLDVRVSVIDCFLFCTLIEKGENWFNKEVEEGSIKRAASSKSHNFSRMACDKRERDASSWVEADKESCSALFESVLMLFCCFLFIRFLVDLDGILY